MKIIFENKKLLLIFSVIILIATYKFAVYLYKYTFYGHFERIPDMNVARAEHLSFLMSDGRVLIVGGDENNTVEIYDPKNKTFKIDTDLSKITSKASNIVLLPNNKLFITPKSYDQTEVIFDIASGQTKKIPKMNEERASYYTILLQNQKVLILGGDSKKPVKPARIKSAEVFNPATNTFIKTNNANYLHVKNGNFIVYTRIIPIFLSDNKVVLFDGETAELFDYKTNSFSKIDTSEMDKRFEMGSNKFITVNFVKTPKEKYNIVDLFEIQNLRIKKIKSLKIYKYNFALSTGAFSLIDKEKVLITGGSKGQAGILTWSSKDAFIYDAKENKLLKINSMNDNRHLHSSISIPNGQILITGGYLSGTEEKTKKSELYIMGRSKL